ncbi:MAG: hypothetical protein KJ808_08655 [Acidobacteria bacterium]|nr:hypothetical protein [Acidobacteriota bacterium]MBU4307190.1 hypothetical protein [Acidobacteriota bacterium]MCG2810265.1 hypothetical protein [Candidatus Aminicenantes bacterium]
MKTDNPDIGSLYQEKKPRHTWFPGAFIPLLLILLLLIHFLNLFLQWTVIKKELADGPAFQTPEYTFIGFSPFNKKKIAAVQLLRNAAPSGRIFAFFDWLHPAIFMVWNNKQKEDFVDLGPVVMAVPPGSSRVSFFPGSVFLLQQGQKIAVKYFGDAIVGQAWHGFLAKKIRDPEANAMPLPGSFVVKALESSRYLKTPYLIYFFLPLLLIAVAVIRFGPVMLAGCIYYVEMFFLFDYQNLFVNVPFGWLFKLVNFENSEASARFFAAALAIVFLAAMVLGFWHWQKRQVSPWQKRILLFFVLLPFFLFF